jgi:hypothetical protein
MNDEIRKFSNNMENKLGAAHRTGGDFEKKFGYEGLSTKNMDDYTIVSGD